MLALQTGKKVQVLLLHYEALSSLAFLEGSLKWSCLDRRRPKEAFFFFSFVYLLICFSSGKMPQLCSFSCYLLTSRFPLL